MRRMMLIALACAFGLMAFAVAGLWRWLFRRARHRMSNGMIVATVSYPMLLLVLSLLHWPAPQRSGWLALSQVIVLYLFLPFVLMRFNTSHEYAAPRQD